jgi:phosphoserine / homoserine phosphotransferase
MDFEEMEVWGKALHESSLICCWNFHQVDSVMHIVCLDLEGVLIPEVWKGLAHLTRIEALERTTRDEPDYDVLMQYRIKILDEHQIGMNEIRKVLESIEPLPGAVQFLDWLRSQTQVIILSDTFQEFAQPLMQHLGHPTIFCHELELEPSGRIAGYKLRQSDQKRHAVNALRGLNYQVTSAGDSFNDLSMLEASHHGILFRPPSSIVASHPQYPVTLNYQELADAIQSILGCAAMVSS